MSRVRSSFRFVFVLSVGLGGAFGVARADEAPRPASVAYVANDAGIIRAFRIDAATGALTPLGAAISSPDKNPYSVAADPAGRWLFVTHGDASSVVAFGIDATSRELKPTAQSRVAT